MISRVHPPCAQAVEMNVPRCTTVRWKSSPFPAKRACAARWAVVSRDANVDAVGACIGPKGARVTPSSMNWRRENRHHQVFRLPEDFVAAALSPATVLR